MQHILKPHSGYLSNGLRGLSVKQGDQLEGYCRNPGERDDSSDPGGNSAGCEQKNKCWIYFEGGANRTFGRLNMEYEREETRVMS